MSSLFFFNHNNFGISISRETAPPHILQNFMTSIIDGLGFNLCTMIHPHYDVIARLITKTQLWLNEQDVTEQLTNQNSLSVQADQSALRKLTFSTTLPLTLSPDYMLQRIQYHLHEGCFRLHILQWYQQGIEFYAQIVDRWIEDSCPITGIKTKKSPKSQPIRFLSTWDATWETHVATADQISVELCTYWEGPGVREMRKRAEFSIWS